MKTKLESIFKAYDVRGKVGSELTPKVAELIGKALADWLPDKGEVAVGRDMRPDSAELARAMIKGLTSQGREVVDIGEVTSDMIYFAVGSNQLAGGAMITASHNPGEYNGIKFCREQAKPIGQDTGLFEIRDLVAENNFLPTKTAGTIQQKDTAKDWIKHVLGFIDANKLKPLKIAVDAGNGMAGKIFPKLEPYVPFEVIEMYFDLDGTFPNHIANPLEPKNLVDIQRVIRKQKCDLGIAFDGDGDRAVLLDENGEPLSGTVLTAILAKYFLEKYPNSTIILNAICGRAAKEVIENSGGKAVRSKVGHSFIKADMRTHDAVFAGEHSGHYYFRDNFMADSGLLAAVVALYVISLHNQKLSSLAAPYRNAYAQINETNFQVDEKETIIQALVEAFADGQQDQLDGLTVNYPDGWLNIRPSNTEPLLRLNAEAKDEATLSQLVSKATDIIKKR